MKKSMKNDLYSIIKQELKTRCRNIRYFNRDFFNTFTAAAKANRENRKSGIDDSYIKDGYITLYHCYDSVYSSDFYNKNSCAYCEFLSVYLEHNTKTA